MSRTLVASIALAALLAGGAWYLASVQVPLTAAAAPEASARGARSPSADIAPGDAPATPAPAALAIAPTAEPARTAVRSASEEELARARWVAGRVVFPPGTPADEELFVTAYGRDFEGGGDQRVRVELDGRFRVAFSEKSRTGFLRLEGRYLFLEEPRLCKRDETEDVVLEPLLGGRIEARLAPPAGFAPAELGGRVRLTRAQRHASGFTFGQEIAWRELAAATEIAFGGLAAEHEYSLDYDGSRCTGMSPAVGVVVGETVYVELSLQPGLIVTGRVLDETGAALPGVQVSAQASSTGHILGAQRHRSERSAEDGTYRLGALVQGRIELNVNHPGFEPFEELLEPPAGGEVIAHDLVLRRGHAIAGMVRWPDGSPAQALLSLCAWPDGERAGDDEGSGPRSGADGSFVISGLSASAYHVRAWTTKTTEVPEVSAVTGRERTRKERATWSAEIERVDVGTDGLELVLGPGLVVRGVVRDASGAALDDFRVSSRRMTFPGRPWETEGLPAGRFRDSGGSFELTGLQPGTWTLQASAKDRADSDPVQVQLPGAGPVELVVAPEAVLRGIVLDAAGAPAAGAQVLVLRAGAAAHASDLLGEERGDHSDGEGRFSIDGLRAGPVILKAVAPSGAPGESLELELTSGATLADLVLHLVPGGRLEGEIVDRDGRAEPGLDVWLQTLDGGFHTALATDSAGRFTGRDLPAGRLSVRATNGEGLALAAVVEIGAGETARVRLAPPSTAPVRLFGRVLAAGSPLAGAEVGAQREGLGQGEPGIRVQAREETDAQGAYEMILPGPGRWLVSAYGFGSGWEHWTAPLDVPEVAELEHDFTLALARVSGRVTDADGEPLAVLWVHSEPQQHDGGPRGSATTQTDADGRYELVVTAGQHAIVAGGSSGPARSGPRNWTQARVEGLRLGEGERRTGVDLVLHPGGVLAGVVRGPSGAPEGRASLWLGGDGELQRIGATDEHGIFRIEGLEPGAHWLRAASSDAATPAAHTVTIRAGETAEVELGLASGVTARVRVLDAAGAPLGCEIEARDEDGRSVPLHYAGEQGAVRLGPLTPGRYRISARREDKLVERTLEIGALGNEIELVLGFD